MTEDINPDEPTKDLTANLSDRQILLDLRRAMGELVERVTALEHRTNPLPPNYDERFTALENDLGEAKKELRLMNRKFEVFAQDFMNTRVDVRDIEERLATLESRPN